MSRYRRRETTMVGIVPTSQFKGAGLVPQSGGYHGHVLQAADYFGERPDASRRGLDRDYPTRRTHQTRGANGDNAHVGTDINHDVAGIEQVN
jgi:hypothetical protein